MKKIKWCKILDKNSIYSFASTNHLCFIEISVKKKILHKMISNGRIRNLCSMDNRNWFYEYFSHHTIWYFLAWYYVILYDTSVHTCLKLSYAILLKCFSHNSVWYFKNFLQDSMWYLAHEEVSHDTSSCAAWIVSFRQPKFISLLEGHVCKILILAWLLVLQITVTVLSAILISKCIIFYEVFN